MKSSSSSPRRPKPACALVLTLLALASAPGLAAGQDVPSRQTANLAFAEQQSGVPSALDFEIDYRNPDDPEGKPPAVRTVLTILAAGAAFDTSVPGRCGASDPELVAQGETACPSGSKVGGGFVRIDTGVAGPGRFLETDVSLLNFTDGLVLLFTDRASGAHVPVRAKVENNTTITESPPLPGAPPDGGAVDVVDLRFDEISRTIGGRERGYITTPDTCPQSGNWVNSIEFTYSDSVTQTTMTQTPCTAAAGPGAKCSNLVRGTKRADALAGSPDSDRLIARSGDDRVAGLAGDDCVRGGAGDDRISGGSGDDAIRAGRGQDRILAGDGDDVIRVPRGARDRVDCGPGDDVVVAARRMDRVASDCERVRVAG